MPKIHCFHIKFIKFNNIYKIINKPSFNWKKVFTINNKTYLRPAEVPSLRGDPRKAQKILKWKAKTKFKVLCEIMLKNDLNNLGFSIKDAKIRAKKINLRK